MLSGIDRTIRPGSQGNIRMRLDSDTQQLKLT